MYNTELLNALFDYIDNRQNSCDFFLLINLENENNDLYKIRQILKKNKIFTPNSQLDLIEDGLSKREIKYSKFNSIDKKFNLDINEILVHKNTSKNWQRTFNFFKSKYIISFGLMRNKDIENKHWFFPFLLGCNYSDYISKYSKRKRKKIYNIVQHYLSDKTEININDSTIIAEIKAK